MQYDLSGTVSWKPLNSTTQPLPKCLLRVTRLEMYLNAHKINIFCQHRPFACHILGAPKVIPVLQAQYELCSGTEKAFSGTVTPAPALSSACLQNLIRENARTLVGHGSKKCNSLTLWFM